LTGLVVDSCFYFLYNKSVKYNDVGNNHVFFCGFKSLPPDSLKRDFSGIYKKDKR
jgi:hypothetical protein